MGLSLVRLAILGAHGVTHYPRRGQRQTDLPLSSARQAAQQTATDCPTLRGEVVATDRRTDRRTGGRGVTASRGGLADRVDGAPEALYPERVRTHIVCLGNEIVADDGIGVRVFRVLSVLPLPSHVRVSLRANLGFELLDLLEELGDEERLVIVDATSADRSPGTCSVTKPSDLNLGPPSAASCHLTGIGQVLAMAAHLLPPDATSSAADRLDRAITMVGIEGECFDQYTTALSNAVRAALPRAVRAVLDLVGADAELLALAIEACDVWIGRDPTIEEACGAPLSPPSRPPRAPS